MNSSILSRIWRIARIPLVVIVILFIGFVIYRAPAVLEKQRTEEMVMKIHAQKLTLDAVDGKHLPPVPDAAQVDAFAEVQFSTDDAPCVMVVGFPVKVSVGACGATGVTVTVTCLVILCANLMQVSVYVVVDCGETF